MAEMPVIKPDGTMHYAAEASRGDDQLDRPDARGRRRRMPRRRQGLAGRVRNRLGLETLPVDRER